MKFGPPINEAVNLLARYAPGRLTSLREEVPSEMLPLLEPGGLAGESSDSLVPYLARSQIEALEEAVDLSNRVIRVAEKRLRASRRFRLGGEIAALVGSASVLSSVPAQAWILALISGVIGLAGSLSTLVAEYYVRLSFEGQSSLYEVYTALMNARYKAKGLLPELCILLEINRDQSHTDRLSTLIGESNAVCEEINRLRSRMLEVSTKEARSLKDKLES